MRNAECGMRIADCGLRKEIFELRFGFWLGRDAVSLGESGIDGMGSDDRQKTFVAGPSAASASMTAMSSN